MFGYIRINKPECKIREYEYYRAVYCGVCRSLGKCTGQCSRLMLSYDLSFMALVRLCLEGISPTLRPCRCLAHPFRRHPMAVPEEGSAEDGVFRLCAAATVLLSYHKIKDDIADERGMRKFRAMVLRPLVSVSGRKARKHYAPLEHLIQEGLIALSAYEKSENVSVDAPAEIFGSIVSGILSYGLEGAEAKIASAIGMHVGKWIYLVDAADDFEEDIRKSRYNPFARAYGTVLTDEDRRSLCTALIAELADAERGFDLLEYPDSDMRAVVENIIYLGMPSVAERVLFHGGDKKGGEV